MAAINGRPVIEPRTGCPGRGVTTEDPCWSDPTERLLLQAVDQLHDTSTVDNTTWSALSTSFGPEELLDIVLLAGWYHAISYAANATQVDLEPWAARFATYI
jgi:hypothetical protein